MENYRALEDNLNSLQTPCYVCEEKLLQNNLELLKKVKQRSGAKILLALKGFAFSPLMPMVMDYLDGCCASGLYEAMYAKEFNAKQIDTYSAAFKEDEFEQICKISNHIVFNSINQYKTLKSKLLKHNSCGLRINPQISTTTCEIYDPCSINSRLGVKKDTLEDELLNNNELLNNIEGFHFHALCEQDSIDLQKVLSAFEKNFSKYFSKLKWINFGGGHHITRDDYDVDLLISLIKNFKEKYPHIEVYLEPGEAIGWRTGTLVASVLDIVQNNKNIAILDTSAEAHMSDTIIMPYKADVRYTNEDFKYTYILAGNTCLAGDVMGEYNFKEPLKIGQKIIFEDMIHYTIVKNTTFNGIKLPSLAVLKNTGELEVIKEFTYEEYKRRN